MKRETPNAKRRAVSISPSSKNHMTATIRKGFALLIEHGVAEGMIGRINYKIEVEGGIYKGITARRVSDDYGVMKTKIDRYEFTASFVGEEAKNESVEKQEAETEAITLTVENAHTAYTVEDKTHPEYGFRLFNYQDQPMNDGEEPLSSIGTGSNGKVIFASEYPLYKIVKTRAAVGLKDNHPRKIEVIDTNIPSAEPEVIETPQEPAINEYEGKEILITLHDPIKGHPVARLVSLGMFSVPDYNAADGWECNTITKDEGKRIERIERWIAEEANEQHDADMKFLKYEIVDEGIFSERELNMQFKMEVEKAIGGECPVKVGDVQISYSVIVNGLQRKRTETIKHVFDGAGKLKKYLEQDSITERSRENAFYLYDWKLNFHCPLWLCIDGETLWLSYDEKNKVYLLASSTSEKEAVVEGNREMINKQRKTVKEELLNLMQNEDHQVAQGNGNAKHA